jgi:hypothetical protein
MDDSREAKGKRESDQVQKVMVGNLSQTPMAGPLTSTARQPGSAPPVLIALVGECSIPVV